MSFDLIKKLNGKKYYLQSILMSIILITTLCNIDSCNIINIKAQKSFKSEHLIFGEAIYNDGIDAAGAKVDVVSDLGTLTTYVEAGGHWDINCGDPGPNWPQQTNFTVWVTGCCGHKGWSGNASGVIAGNQNYMDLIIVYPNTPPNQPNKPQGPQFLNIGEIGMFTTSATDPNVLNNVQYRFDWDSTGGHDFSNYTTYVKPGETANKTHSWDTPGTYTIKSQARDQYGALSEWSEGYYITIYSSNYPPEKPNIDGPNQGFKDTSIFFNFTSTDQDNHEIKYLIDWGDGTETDWTDSYPSGSTIPMQHKWTERGTYEIKAKAKDIYEVESDFSNPFNIQIGAPEIKIKRIYNNFLNIKIDIENIGEDAAENVYWDIHLEGGVLIFGENTNGKINKINPGEIITIKTNLIFGFSTKTIATINASINGQNQVTTEEELIIFFTFIFY